MSVEWFSRPSATEISLSMLANLPFGDTQESSAISRIFTFCMGAFPTDAVAKASPTQRSEIFPERLRGHRLGSRFRRHRLGIRLRGEDLPDHFLDRRVFHAYVVHP